MSSEWARSLSVSTKPERELSAYTILETPLWRQMVSVMHEWLAGLGGLRNEHAKGPLRYGPLGSDRIGCSDRWCFERVVLGGVK